MINVSDEDRSAFTALYGKAFDADRPWKKPKSLFTSRRGPQARDIDLGGASARLVVVPTMPGGGDKAKDYAAALYQDVVDAPPGTCGYLVDLRGNQGGNMWPMVLGTSALLGDGWKSFEVDRAGRLSSYATLKNGAAVIESGDQAGLTIIDLPNWRPLPQLAAMPVAVLIDDAVGSSGEGVAVAFRSRPRTRFFGERTSGHASSNEGFVVDDRVNVVVTTAMMADRYGRIYPEGLDPDEMVEAPVGDASAPIDAMVERAKAWLSLQPACRTAGQITPRGQSVISSGTP